MDVGTAVGLLVEADDVDDAQLLDRFGDEAHLGADQVGIEHRLLAGDERDLDGAGPAQLGVDPLLHHGAERLRQGVELEVHAGRERLHVPAGDRHPPLVPDDAAEDVEGGVGPHQGVPAVPVDGGGDGLARAGQRAVAFQGVPDVVALLADVDHALAGDPTGVMGLAAPGGVEDGPVQAHPACLGFDGGHLDVGLPQVGVAQVERFGRHRSIVAGRVVTPKARRCGRGGP